MHCDTVRSGSDERLAGKWLPPRPPSGTDKDDMTKPVILFLAANPDGTSRIALDEECAAIEREIAMTPGRDDFELRSKWAVTVDDLMRELAGHKATIIHFSGHGNANGIVLHRD